MLLARTYRRRRGRRRREGSNSFDCCSGGGSPIDEMDDRNGRVHINVVKTSINCKNILVANPKPSQALARSPDQSNPYLLSGVCSYDCSSTAWLKISEDPIVSVVPTVLCTKASSACKVEDVSVENYVCTCQQSSDFATVKTRDNRQTNSSTRKSATRMDFAVCVCVRAMRNTRTSACPW